MKTTLSFLFSSAFLQSKKWQKYSVLFSVGKPLKWRYFFSFRVNNINCIDNFPITGDLV